MIQKSYDDSPTLYLVPTPIGNMEDMTFRAINILKMVEVVFSEDTRVSGLLLNYFDIKKKIISLHEHNEDEKKEVVLGYLKDGKSVALVTDRGTPVISDPGFKTVKYVASNGYNVVAIPGACALITALVASGISGEHFLFYGFLNSKKSKREDELNNLKNVSNTIIFYEAPHRIKDMLSSINNIFGRREICICREISKKFETIYRGYTDELKLDENDCKGEFVVVVSGAINSVEKENVDIIQEINNYVLSGVKLNDAIKMVAQMVNKPKSLVYQEYHRRYKK